jgi:hypothetical protein
LKNPGRGEETWPGLDLVVEAFGLLWHEEARIAPNLSELGVPQAVLNDAINEGESHWVLFHLHAIEVIQKEFTHTLENDGVEFVEEWLCALY